MTATDLVLLKRWRTRRDPEAFQELVHRHANMVFATCRRVLGNAADAEEVAQDCFLSLADSANKPTRSLGGWLHVLATSRARDRIRGDVRRRQREKRFASEQESKAETPEAVAVLDDALAALPNRLREPLVVHFLEGLTHDETATRLGVSRPTVTRRINKALARLREEMRGRKAIITAAALTKLLTAESASAAPATLVAALGTIALNASPYAVAAGGGGLFVGAFGVLGAVAMIAIAAAIIGVAAPRSIENTTASNAQNTIVTAQPTSTTASDPTVATTITLPQPSEEVEVLDQTLDAPAGARIHGVVRDLAGNPLSGVNVNVHGGREAFATTGFDETDEDGRYTIEGVPPTDALYVRALTKSPQRKAPPLNVGAVVAGETYEADLTLHESSIAGFVVNRSGRPIADADVWARVEDQMSFGALPMAATDSEGQFEVTGLTAGTYDMRVRTGGEKQPWVDTERIVLAETEYPTQLRLVYDQSGTKWLWGNVVDSEGNGVPDAKVNAFDRVTYESTFKFSDSDGAFLIALTGDGPFNVQINHRDYGTALQRNVSPDTGPLVILLNARGQIRGRVVDWQSGKPITQFEVLAYVPVTEATDTLYTQDWLPVADPNGAFTLEELEPGTQSVKVRTKGFAETDQKVRVYAGQETTDVEVLLERARTIAGVVVDNTGEPVTGARVFAGPLPLHFRSGTSTIRELELTDTEGRFQIDEAPSSLQTVSAAHPAFAPVTQAVTGDLDGIRIVLQAGGSIAGTVTIDGEPAIEAHVNVLHGQITQPVLVARTATGVDGSFVLRNVGPGSTMVHGGVRLKTPFGRREMYRTVNVENDSTLHMQFEFVTGTSGVYGNVARDGLPVTNALIMAIQTTNDSDADMTMVSTDVNGNYRIEGLPSGIYELETRIDWIDNDMQPAVQTISIADGESIRVDVVD